MNSTLYSRLPIDEADLKKIRRTALDALTATPHGREFASSLVLVALCQGAAQHYAVLHGEACRYLDPDKAGLKDIDVWLFFSRPGFNARWRQARDFGPSKFGSSPEDAGYAGRRIDVLGRSLPLEAGESVEQTLRRWLTDAKPGSSPWYLSQKAVVGLYPERFSGRVLWVNPDLR